MEQQKQPRLLIGTIVCILALLVCRCRKDEAVVDLEINEAYRTADVTCDNLYQGDSVEDAVDFMNVPEERRQQMVKILERYGPLASAEELKFANRVFKVGRTKRASDYRALLSKKMLQLLGKNNDDTFLWSKIDNIEKGHFLYACCEDSYYGPCGAKFAVTFGKVPPETLEREGHDLHFPQAPTHVFQFFHFHMPNYMINGLPVYVVMENSSYRIVSESFKGGAPRTASLSPRVESVTESGIEQWRKTQNEEDSWHWNIAISSKDKQDNKIEIVMESTSVSDDPNTSSISENVLYDYDAFRKYCRVWDDVRFHLSASLKPDKNHIFYVCRIGDSSRSTPHRYPGREIIEVNIEENGLFKQGRLNLFTFDSVDDTNIRYSNAVFVRMSPKQAVD